MSEQPTTDGGQGDPATGVDADAPAEEEIPAVPRGWSERRRGMDPEARRRVMDACAVRTSSGWVTHFVLMMVLSVVVAVMGLSANSAALVIGAVLLAPLMTPVLGTAASLTMALGGPLKRSLLVLFLATAGAIALSWMVALFLRDGPLSSEVIARTSPDARDLIVALAAGAAGAVADDHAVELDRGAATRAVVDTTRPGAAAVALGDRQAGELDGVSGHDREHGEGRRRQAALDGDPVGADNDGVNLALGHQLACAAVSHKGNRDAIVE